MAPSMKALTARLSFFLDLVLRRNRRQFQRYVVREITPVFIGKGIPEAASLIDISMGGVALDYTAGDYPVKKIFALDLHAKDGFQLGKVLLEKLSDKRLSGGEGPHTHRLRAQFLNLSQAKANKLETFLEIYQQ